MSVSEQDVGRGIDLVGGHLSGRVVRLEEGIDQDARVAVHQVDRRVAVVVDLHLVSPPSSAQVPAARASRRWPTLPRPRPASPCAFPRRAACGGQPAAPPRPAWSPPPAPPRRATPQTTPWPPEPRRRS